jgi:predicted nucleic acid-binding protein
MKRTTIYFEPELEARLKAETLRRKQPMAEIVREAFYQGLVAASYLQVELEQERIVRMAEIDEQFASLDLGFVDCAVVALAESLGVPRIATTDRRHFEPLAAAFALKLLPEPPEAG